jgi:hypothetical protein
MSLNESIVEEAALEWFLLRHLLRQGYEGQEGYGGQVRERATGKQYLQVRLERRINP